MKPESDKPVDEKQVIHDVTVALKSFISQGDPQAVQGVMRYLEGIVGTEELIRLIGQMTPPQPKP